MSKCLRQKTVKGGRLAAINSASAGITFCRILALSALLLSYGCSTTHGPKAQTGTAVGALTGAILGSQIDHDHGALFGAAIGAIAGSSIGRYQDEQQRALEAALANERRNRYIEIQRLQDETLQVSLSSDACFDFDQSQIKPRFYRALDKLSNELTYFNKTVLHIEGHTDDIGNNDYNYALSIRRAQSVAQYLSLNGISSNRLRIHGHGELEPRVANTNPENRRLNRRVEIFIKPIAAGQENKSLVSPYSRAL